jgi:TonB family protein
MNDVGFWEGRHGLPHFATRLIQGTALALAVAFVLPMPARADDRAVKSRVAPVYPEIARRMRITGAVVLEVTVDAEGKVSDVRTVSGNHALGPAAEDAVRKWKFAPGAGVSTLQVEVNFSLGQ